MSTPVRKKEKSYSGSLEGARRDGTGDILLVAPDASLATGARLNFGKNSHGSTLSHGRTGLEDSEEEQLEMEEGGAMRMR